jgi:hypothetical protein
MRTLQCVFYAMVVYLLAQAVDALEQPSPLLGGMSGPAVLGIAGAAVFVLGAFVFAVSDLGLAYNTAGPTGGDAK